MRILFSRRKLLIGEIRGISGRNDNFQKQGTGKSGLKPERESEPKRKSKPKRKFAHYQAKPGKKTDLKPSGVVHK